MTEKTEEQWLRDELHDLRLLTGMQHAVLTATINVLRGDPPENVWWSTHDVADVAREVVAERDALKRVVDVIAAPSIYEHPTTEHLVACAREAVAAVGQVDDLAMELDRLRGLLDQHGIKAGVGTITSGLIYCSDPEKHAEHYNEGYADAERQMTEPLPGYDEPDGDNPQHVEFAANVLQSIDHLTQISGTSRLLVAARLHDRAIRLRRDGDLRSAAAAAHETALEELARKSFASWCRTVGRSDCDWDTEEPSTQRRWQIFARELSATEVPNV